MTKSRDLTLILPAFLESQFQVLHFCKIRVQGISLLLGIPGCRNAEMSQRLFFRVFVFHKIKVQGISLLFVIPGCRNAKMFQHLFFQVFAFQEIRVQGISLLLGIPGCRNAKIPMTQDLRLRSLSDRRLCLFWHFAFRNFVSYGAVHLSSRLSKCQIS
jgi:hypothetical protein